MTPEGIEHLNALRADMGLALAQARVYQDALTNVYDTPHVWPSLRRWLSVRRMTRRMQVKQDEVVRISAVIQANVAVEALLAGPERGPIIRTPHSTRP